MTAMRKTLRKTWITTPAICNPDIRIGMRKKALMGHRPQEIHQPRDFRIAMEHGERKYSYLTYKDIDWDAKYAPNTNLKSTKAHPRTNCTKYWPTCFYELRDGHVNLYAGFNYARNWEWYLDSPQNFNYTIIERNYLGRDYWASGGLRNAFLDLQRNTDTYTIRRSIHRYRTWAWCWIGSKTRTA